MKDRPSILVVDDDPNISRLEQLYLEKENFEVRVADRGDTALEQFRQNPPDLILLDVMLPGMDGYQVLKAVRKSGNIPVIMVTARGETFDKVLCLELGADDYITKPFDGKEMTARVKAVLRRVQGGEEEKQADVSWPGLTVNSCSPRYGDSNSSGTAGPWTSISSGCGRNCLRARNTAGPCIRCGASGTNSASSEQ